MVKGILKTLEAFIALFLAFTFLLVFIPQERIDDFSEPVGFLSVLGENNDFRSCVIAKNTTCISQTIDDNLDENFDFKFNLSDTSTGLADNLPAVQIFSESLFFTGNVTVNSTVILRVFYWNR